MRTLVILASLPLATVVGADPLCSLLTVSEACQTSRTLADGRVTSRTRPPCAAAAVNAS
jgi:hypothetical protein